MWFRISGPPKAKQMWLGYQKLVHPDIRINKAFIPGRQDHGGIWLFPWNWICRLDRHISFVARYRKSRPKQPERKEHEHGISNQIRECNYFFWTMRSLEVFFGQQAMNMNALFFMRQSYYRQNLLELWKQYRSQDNFYHVSLTSLVLLNLVIRH